MNNLANKLIENYKKFPNKICLIQKDKTITYEELYFKVRDLKEYLEKKGIKKNEKVLLLIEMSIELYVSIIAVWTIGAIPCFMDAGFIKSNLKKNNFKNINSIIGTKKYIIYSNINKNLKKIKTKININQAIKYKSKENNKLEIEEIKKEYPGILTYTSGTTGQPKIASRTHEFLANQGEIIKNNIDYEKDDIEISTIPIFTLSNINSGIQTVIANANFMKLYKSNPKKIIRQIKKNNVNRIMAAPGILEPIIKYCEKNKIKKYQIKKIFTGGGAIFIDFLERIKKIFPNAKIVTLYGSTEAEPIAKLYVNNMTKEQIEKTKNGYGILAGNIVGVDICKIINTNKKEIGSITKEEFENITTEEVGEIVVSGKNVLEGYIDGIGDKENKFTVEGIRFHRTGDMGYIDKNGLLWLRGRKKEPYFNIEASLHAKFYLGKTAVFKENEKIILVIEKKRKNISEEKLKKEINFKKIDEIKYVKKIPVDKRHNTKVDYKELRKVLKK